MNARQYKHRFLVSKVNECLRNATQSIHAKRFGSAEYQINVALSFARQLPSIPKYRALRAHIVTAREALQ